MVDRSLLARNSAIISSRQITTNPLNNHETKTALDLLQLLNKMNIQLYAFDAIYAWARKSSGQHGHNFAESTISRKRFIQDLAKLNGTSLLQATTTQITLPYTQVRTNLTTISFRECLYSLLTDNKLMRQENLIFRGQTPFTRPTATNAPADPTHLYDDIDSGTVYRDAWEKLCPPGSNKVYLPLIFFIDKTFVDKKGKLNSEPVTFTLGIFKRNVRNNNDTAWRSLGMIPDAFLKKGDHESTEKTADYHHAISLIFSEYRSIQDSTGIEWDLEYNNTLHNVIFVPAIHLIITDTKAADDMAGKIQFRGTTEKNIPNRICRFCNKPGKQIDCPLRNYRLTSSRDIETLYTNGNFDTIKKICYRPIQNAFWNLRIADPQGINGCMPPDTLHVHLKGLDPYLREGFYGLQRPRAPERTLIIKQQIHFRRHGCLPGNEENAPLAIQPLAEDKEGNSLFTKTSNPPFEAIAFAISKQLKHQSDRTLPRTHFTQGITENFAKLTGSEETGILLLILLALCTTAADTMFTEDKGNMPTFIGIFRLSQWVGTLERFLQLEQWSKDTENTIGHTERDLKKIEKYIPKLIQRFKDTIERRTGLGTKLVKLHLLMHVVECHRKYGRPDNFNTAYGETRHKHFAKNPGKRTQRQKDTFDKETAERNIEDITVRLAVSLAPQQAEAQPQPPQHEQDTCTLGYLYDIHRNTATTRHPRSRCFVPLDDNQTLPATRVAVRLLAEHVLPRLPRCSSHLTTYHSIKHQGTIYRSCPKYKKGPWYDWALLAHPAPDMTGWIPKPNRQQPRRPVNYSPVNPPNTLTVLILLIFKQEDSYPEPIIIQNDCDISSPGTYIAYQRLNGQENHYKTHPESTMLFSAKIDPTIRLAKVSWIAGPAIVYRDFDFTDKKQLTGLHPTEWYGTIKTKPHWTLLFADRAYNDESAVNNVPHNI
jgi:hypothetical protein